jgi:hypothetical protein
MDEEEAIAVHLETLRYRVKALRLAREALWDEVRCIVEDGVTWQQVGLALGISRQAAHERFSKPPPGKLV